MAKENDMFVGGEEKEVVTCEVNNKPQPTKQEKRRKTFIKVAVGLAIVATLGMVAFALVGCNNNQLGQNNGNNPGISQGGGNNGGGTGPVVNQGNGNGQDDPSINPGGNGGQDDPVVDPVDPPAPVITEADYKNMFETNILGAIEKEYNEGKPDGLKLFDLENLSINYATGDISFTCTQNNNQRYVETTSEEITKHQTFKAQNENFQTKGFKLEFSSRQTNEELVEQIVEFALSQPAVQTFAQENNLDLENLEILNVEKFSGDDETFNRITKITAISGDKQFSFKIGGPTGYKSTEEGYLNRLEELVETNDVCVEDFTIKTYADLDAEDSTTQTCEDLDAEDSATQTCEDLDAESSASAEIINAMQNQFPDYDISMGL